ncbi:MAG: hypothetical protein R6U86_03280, partial [Bacteroidales bacterium]
MIAYGGCPILNTAAEADDTHQVLRQMTVDAIKTMKKTIAAVLEDGKGSGEFNDNTDAGKMAQVIIALI